MSPTPRKNTFRSTVTRKLLDEMYASGELKTSMPATYVYDMKQEIRDEYPLQAKKSFETAYYNWRKQVLVAEEKARTSGIAPPKGENPVGCHVAYQYVTYGSFHCHVHRSTCRG